MALLTGLRCWSDELPHQDYAHKPYDNFPFIWKNFSKSGYATFYAEDMPGMAAFTLHTRGFVEQPTDHNMRTFWLAQSKEEVGSGNLAPVYRFLENKNVKLQKSSTFCYKNTPKHLIQMNHLKQFIETYKDKRRFGMSFLVELSHEYQNFLTYADDDIAEFLTWFKTSGQLDNTVLIVFSDHGSRIETVRNTPVGRLEDRLPMLHLVLPKSLRSKHPEFHSILKENENRVATAFDVHQTISDVLYQRFNNPTKSYVSGKVRGISLFQPLPTDRSCAEAWIPENYCPCYTSVSVDLDSPIVHKIAQQMVQDLNKRLQHLQECVQLTLNKVRDVGKISQPLQVTETEGTGLTGILFFKAKPPDLDHSQRYEISIETKPGLGTFEATYIAYNEEQFALMGDIVRTNKYGDQSDCITEKLLRPICYCQHHLNSSKGA